MTPEEYGAYRKTVRTSVSFFISRNQPGTGPELHRHPYEATFIVANGRVRFTIGEETIETTAGEIGVVPAGTTHRFVNSGPIPMRQISIHPVAPGWRRSGWPDKKCRLEGDSMDEGAPKDSTRIAFDRLREGPPRVPNAGTRILKGRGHSLTSEALAAVPEEVFEARTGTRSEPKPAT